MAHAASLGQLFLQYTGQQATEQKELSASGSNRRYFRLSNEKCSVIGVQGTSEAENKAFIYLAKHFKEKGLNVPTVLAVSEDSMTYIQEDLGDTLLFDYIAEGRKSNPSAPVTWKRAMARIVLRNISFSLLTP